MQTRKIEITDSAVMAIKKYKIDNNVDENKWLRCGLRGGGCRGATYFLNMDEQHSFDNVFEKDGCKVFIDAKSMIFLDGIIIDYVGGLQKGFKIINENKKGECGCGESIEI